MSRWFYDNAYAEWYLNSLRLKGSPTYKHRGETYGVLRGWGNYFRTGTCSREFLNIDRFVYSRLVRWTYRRGGQRPTRRGIWTGEQFWAMGLYRLRGTVRYPAQATPGRSSLSRVQENRTHGLKGVC